MSVDLPECIESGRLRLRRCEEVDAAGLLGLVESSREQLLESFPNLAKPVRTVTDAELFLKSALDAWNAQTRYFYGIFDNASLTLIGQLTVKNIDWDVPAAEVSYFIGQASQRRGFALEALRALCETAFGPAGFKRIQARVVVTNSPSLSLLQKAGFRLEGRHRQAFRCGRGRLHDIDMYSLTDLDWAGFMGSQAF